MSRLTAGWPAEAVAERHERVGMRLQHLAQPWPAAEVARVEQEEAARLVVTGRVQRLRWQEAR
jgi:hypothetical protein